MKSKDLIEVAIREDVIEEKDIKKVIVDTTVQEKAITFPTDSKLQHKARLLLLKEARKHGIKLRQSYLRLGKKALFRGSRYASANQMKRARKQTKLVKRYLGCVYRDIKRQLEVRHEADINLGVKVPGGSNNIEDIIKIISNNSYLKRKEKKPLSFVVYNFDGESHEYPDQRKFLAKTSKKSDQKFLWQAAFNAINRSASWVSLEFFLKRLEDQKIKNAILIYAFVFAVKMREMDLLKGVLKSKLNPNCLFFKFEEKEDRPYNTTALCVAAKNGYSEIAKILMSDPRIDASIPCGPDQKTASTYAREEGYTEIAYLIQNLHRQVGQVEKTDYNCMLGKEVEEKIIEIDSAIHPYLY